MNTPAPPSTDGGITQVDTASGYGVSEAQFRKNIPVLPGIASARETGAILQNSRVGGRDNGQSTGYGNKSVWIFDDTTYKNPWGFVSNTGAITKDLDASDGITLTSGNPVTEKADQTPQIVIPLNDEEKAFQAAHDKDTGCTTQTDQYCGASFAFWPGSIVADPARGRVLVFYGKLCRGGGAGSPCSGSLGKGLGGGIAAITMSTGAVTRLNATGRTMVKSIEGNDPTMLFDANTGYYGQATTVVNNSLYAYGDCTYGCKVAKVALDKVSDRSSWSFYTGGAGTEASWSHDMGVAKSVVGGGGAGQTIFYSPALRSWVNVFMPYGTNTAKYQVGASPFGPWSQEATILETTPGAVGTSDTAAGISNNYALFAHPEYAQDNGLIQYLTYFKPGDGSQQLVKIKFKQP